MSDYAYHKVEMHPIEQRTTAAGQANVLTESSPSRTTKRQGHRCQSLH